MFSSFSSRAQIYAGIFAVFVAVVAVIRLLNLVDYSVGSRTGIVSK